MRGFAHVLVLELLDELGIKPKIIAGTSVGAVVGALYASGMSGREIHDLVHRLVISRTDKWEVIVEKGKELIKWFDAFRPDLEKGGFVRTDRLLNHLMHLTKGRTFKDLRIPLIVVAADYWSGEEVVFDKGELLPPLQASMAMPGVFAPAQIDGRVLVDGGVVNLVPYEHILDRCDVTIAVHVGKRRTPQGKTTPNALESVLGTFDIMQSAILAEKLKRRKPHILVRPELSNIRTLDFKMVDDVMTRSQPAVDALREDLEKLIDGQPVGESQSSSPWDEW